MSLPADPKSDLQKAIKSRGAIIVAGTGVSIAATNNHPQASWTGLLKSGLERLKKHRLMSAKDSAAYLRLLDGPPETVQFIATAQAITRKMSADMLSEWLKETIGSIKACDHQVLDALEEIRRCGNILATTNYDGLLLEGRPGLSAVTWKDKTAFLSAHRHRWTEHVLFLHGYWDAPESVILDERSYQEITRELSYRDDLTAVWRTSTWIYVGCGENGLSDPDIGLLLELYGKRARDDHHWDFCLVRNADKDRLQRYFNEKGHNICAVGFGENHGDLPGYLRSLLPPPFVGPPHVPLVSVPVVAAHSGGTHPSIPEPPAFYAESDYIGRNTFIGRAAQLQVLSDWAMPSDKTTVLLFEAIGGNGKSMLTWEWAKDEDGKHASTVREWAGRFWYSFYEKGAVMRDFCQHALAYMLRQPLETFEKSPMDALRKTLVAQLHERPWLLVLDGLERVLVAYHRIDAAEVADEEVNRPTDKILDREPCDAILDEDTDLLRALTGAAPSKILISSRLVPRALLNASGLPLPGVRPLELPGLDEADAEALLCCCGVKGSSDDIRYYLKNYCANHPLTIGVLAGLINSHGPHCGDFDGWVADPAYGAGLNLASLDLIQSRNHILRAALDALEPASRQLLSILALLGNAVDYETVAAFNPHLPSQPEEVENPRSPETDWRWERRTDDEKRVMRTKYEADLAKRKDYEQAMRAWRDSPALNDAPKKLGNTLRDLEQRGLLQWDGRTKRYDLHPVVRGVAAGGMKAEEKERHGLRVVDHFSSQPHNPYEEAKTMADVENGLHVVRTLLKLGHYQQAVDAYRGDLANALGINLEAYEEILSLLRPFFPAGWDVLPKDMNASDASYLANAAAIALDCRREHQKALGAYGACLRVDLESENWTEGGTRLRNISTTLSNQNLLARGLRMDGIALDLANVCGDDRGIFKSLLWLFVDHSLLGQWREAEATWRRLDSMGRKWPRQAYGQGQAEYLFAGFQFWQGTLQESHLIAATTLAEQDGNRMTLRTLHRLRGNWRMEQGEWALAAESFLYAVTMARESRLVDEASETGLILAKHHLGLLAEDVARNEAERLGKLLDPAHRTLALLWLAIGDSELAKHHALAAYRNAWADGEPYVYRYELTKATELLEKMKVPIPQLPPYDPAKDEPFPWEAEVRAIIERLRAEKEAKENGKNSQGSESA